MINRWKIVMGAAFSFISLISCSSPKSIAITEILQSIDSFPAALENVRKFERAIYSKDISYEYLVGLDTSLYPNKFRYKLTRVKRFLRPGPIDGLDHIIEYYATSDDSVRTILHEWNVAKTSGFLLTKSPETNLDSPQTRIIKAFQIKFNQLDSALTSKFGSPVIKDIEGNFLHETGRDDIKWKSKNGLGVYLLMFKRDMNTYRQIRVILYPK